MAVLNFADRIYLNGQEVDQVYLDGVQVWPSLPVNLYDQNDACSIGAAESESIGAGWVATGSTLSIDIGNNSNWCLKATSQISTSTGGYARLNLLGLEVGATYRMTMDSRTTDDTELAAGQGWFDARSSGGWVSQKFFDILSFGWEQHSLEVTATRTDCFCTLYAGYSSSGAQVGWSCYLDNILIEKIS